VTDVAFPVEGRVTAIYVGVGDEVEAGELLAELDDSAYVAERQLAQSAYDVAQAQAMAAENRLENDRRRAEIDLARAQIQLDFAREQAGELPTAEQAVNIALLELDVEVALLALDEIAAGIDPALSAAVEQARLRLNELEARITGTKLLAPASGTVVQVALSAGESATPELTALALADLTDLEIEAFVQDGDLREMAEGLETEVAFATQPGDTFAATVRALPPPYGTGDFLEASTARFAFTDPAVIAQFEPGERVTLNLVLAEQADVLWLPPAAVRDFQGRHFVVIQEEETQRRVDVMLGIEGASRVEILEGVAEGDIIVGP
jgi:multidrug efflux pump subunit AcrA (membrane-fusion protein)